MSEPFLDPEEEIKFAVETITNTKEKYRAVLNIAYRLAKQVKQWRNLADQLKQSLDYVRDNQQMSCGWCGQNFGVVKRDDDDAVKLLKAEMRSHALKCPLNPASIKIAELESEIASLREEHQQPGKARRCPGCGEIKVEETVHCTKCGTFLR